MRGFGRSSVPQGLFSPTDDLKQLFDYFQIKKAHLVGLSMGGSVAINYALKEQESILSLTLINTALEGYVPPNNSLASVYEQIEIYARNLQLNLARKLWLELPHFVPVSRCEQAMKVVRKMTDRYTFWHFRNPNPVSRSEPPTICLLEEIKIPVCIMIGELDVEESRAIAAILLEKLSGTIYPMFIQSGKDPHFYKWDF